MVPGEGCLRSCAIRASSSASPIALLRWNVRELGQSRALQLLLPGWAVFGGGMPTGPHRADTCSVSHAGTTKLAFQAHQVGW